MSAGDQEDQARGPAGRSGGPSNRQLGVLAGVALLAVIVAVVVIIAGSGSSNSSSTTTSAAGSGSSPTATIPASVTASTTTSAGTTSTAGGSATATTPAGGPVPSGFEPESFTAVSDSTWWLLGSASCASPPCTSVVRTTNGGQTFVGIPAPRTDAVTGLRFANAEDGFAYGTQLWSTHDGGRSWKRVAVSGQVQDLEASAGYVYAAGAAGLLRSPVGADDWTVIHTGDFQSVWAQGSEVLASENGSSGPLLVSSANGGATFAAHAAPPTVACDFQTTGDGVIWAPCATGMDSAVWRSGDGGAHWVAAGSTGGEGQPNSAAFAAASGETAVYGSSQVYRTTDGAKTWTAVPSLSSGNDSLRVTYLGFSDASHGVAIVQDSSGQSTTAKLEVTSDGGASYTPVTIAGG